jgi:hypothetical protein
MFGFWNCYLEIVGTSEHGGFSDRDRGPTREPRLADGCPFNLLTDNRSVRLISQE